MEILERLLIVARDEAGVLQGRCRGTRSLLCADGSSPGVAKEIGPCTETSDCSDRQLVNFAAERPGRTVQSVSNKTGMAHGYPAGQLTYAANERSSGWRTSHPGTSSSGRRPESLQTVV